jgi:hypothetical protein
LDVRDYPQNTTPLHCIYSRQIEVYKYYGDSIVEERFRHIIDENTVTFSNKSVIHSSNFDSHPEQNLWNLGMEPNACLFYQGTSFIN